MRDRSAKVLNTNSNLNSTNLYTTVSENTHLFIISPLSLDLSVPLSQVYLPPTYSALLLLVGDAVLYGLLAWYLDAVIRGNHIYVHMYLWTQCMCIIFNDFIISSLIHIGNHGIPRKL